MKSSCTIRSLLVIFAICIAGGSSLKAQAESGENLIPILAEANSQSTPNLTLEAAYQLAQTSNPTPTPEAPPQENSSQKPEEKGHRCSDIDNSTTPNNKTIEVDGIQITGISAFNKPDIEKAFQNYKPDREESKPQESEPEEKLRDAIIKLYLDKNYINTTAYWDKEKKEIRVTEGRIRWIEILGTRRLNSSYICSRVKRGVSIPLNTANLEESLRLLKVDPLLENVEASLRKTGNEGETDLIVRVKEADSFVSSIGVDNYSPPSVGGEKFSVDLRYRNLTGIGDEIAASYSRSFTGGAEIFDFSYQVPLNAMNGTLQLRAAPNRNRITQKPFDEFGIRGEQEVYEINYRQPLIRTLEEEFALSVGFTYQSGQTFIFDLPDFFGLGPDENGVSRTSTIRFSQDYIRRDNQGAWSFVSQFNFGIGLLDATTNEAPIPDGRFFSWLGQIQRAQQIGNRGDNNWLIIQAELQLTPDSLLPSQQFVIGGGQSVRGYRQNVRSGDNGFRLSVESRMTIQRNSSGNSTLTLIPFIDAGYVWNKSDNPNPLPNQTFLVGAGLGLQWEQVLGFPGLTVRLDYGFPFINLSDRGSNIQDDGIYFNLRYKL
ncbi:MULTISPECIES: ShlB/FhaC/HecB family hemolysin secretion/activation protein [Calothrix]|uniref:ShlB/FhaC/HecB family hemolysin secretion/activation protein n=2 Tax=Calothrix TaxID=1186 RepID=A0ABR8AMC6_9CYAN|nr:MULTISPECIES: ShlB/FhaC/HecB family hemolysin secretion/activation protein [Calothrix]MBD2200700.1 ShlB/FhaC/HecB family hemolysin secretion/activation protein [Calothrix parietina FACHB-288]MBD2229750.1 ShlB/FhaC/HecB family hemolysin secretion/activation protein [Calothrix anomala FACHB-343]